MALYKEENAVQLHHHLHPPIAQVKEATEFIRDPETEMAPASFKLVSLALLSICIYSPVYSAPATIVTIYHSESGSLVRATPAVVTADGVDGGEYHWLQLHIPTVHCMYYYNNIIIT